MDNEIKQRVIQTWKELYNYPIIYFQDNEF